MKVCSVCQRCYDDTVLSCSEENHDSLIETRAGDCEIVPNYRLEYLDELTPDGEIYRAVNTILKKPYFIKIVAPGTFGETAKKQFLSEAQALSSIIHPNVARVFESGTLEDDSLYVVTEFITAQTLRECLTNVGAPSEVTALTITRQAAEGLEALHAANVLHRGIRPENIILTADAENRFLVKLQNIDFGAIRQSQVIANAEQNLSDLRYFSPEQCAVKETDAQTDIYSLGVVLYETLAGQVPFDAPYADALIAKQIKDTPPPVKINSFDIRMLLTHTLTDALQKQARTRLKSANAFARRIRHIEQLATHSSTPPPAMSYPAKLDKAAVVFTPPAKVEKIEKAVPLKENPVPIKIKTIIKDLPVFETSTVIENPPAFEMQAMIESPVIAENIENPVPVEVETIFEAPPVTENPPVVETVTALESQMVEELPLVENEAVSEETVEAAPVVEDLAAIEAPAMLEEIPAAVEAQTVLESLPEVEMQTVIEDSVAVENPLIVEDSAFTETQMAAEDSIPVETEEAAEELVFAETEPVVADVVLVEAQPEIEDLISIETDAAVEDEISIEAQSAVEDEIPVAPLTTFEAPSIIDDLPLVETQTIFEDSIPVEIQTVAEEPVFFENQPVSETELPIEAQAEESETATRVFVDLTTTKLPPIESVVKKPLPENIVITEITPIFTLKDGFLDIHKTSEPALVEWEQPDDVPTTTQALNTSRKAIADAQFAPKADFTRDEEDYIDDDYIIDAGDVDSPVDFESEDYEEEPDYAAERPVFSYDDSGTSWNLPDKRKILTGAGLFALLILAVGGVMLSRQFLAARSARQTTAQSSPNVKTLPKAAEPEKVAESDKLSTNPADSTVSNPLPAADVPDVPELPNYQPREADVKTVLPASTENRNKKRVLKEAVEKLEQTVQTKTAANETPVFDKKGNVKLPVDKKTPVKNQASTSTKTDIFTRPRIVKNPQF